MSIAQKAFFDWEPFSVRKGVEFLLIRIEYEFRISSGPVQYQLSLWIYKITIILV